MFCQFSYRKIISHRHSHIADLGQESADQFLMFAADVLLKGALQPVLNVTNLQDPAGVPAYTQATQRGSQHKVVLSELTGRAEVEQIPQAGVQEDFSQLTTGEGQSHAAVLVQEGEKVEETFAVELCEMHGE